MSKTTETLNEMLIEENARYRPDEAERVEALEKALEAFKRIEGYETLRPVWAQGWTDDSSAAQASSAALGQLWKLLGATNQTDAVIKLKALQRQIELDEMVRQQDLQQLEQWKNWIARLRQCLGFFASVIKSGESWTETCEKEYRAALTPSPEN